MAQEKWEEKMNALSSKERPWAFHPEIRGPGCRAVPIKGDVLQQRAKLEEGRGHRSPFTHPTDPPGADTAPGSGPGSGPREMNRPLRCVRSDQPQRGSPGEGKSGGHPRRKQPALLQGVLRASLRREPLNLKNE